MFMDITPEQIVNRASVKELKDLQDRIVHRLAYLTGIKLTSYEEGLVRSGAIIAAIKELRTRCGLCLIDAKNIVDSYKTANWSELTTNKED
jgi:hypothetical protein